MRVWLAITAVIVAIAAFVSGHHRTQENVTYFDATGDACRAVDHRITTCENDYFGIDIQTVRIRYEFSDLSVIVRTRSLNALNTNDQRSLFVVDTEDNPWPLGYQVRTMSGRATPRLFLPPDQIVDCSDLKLKTDLKTNEYRLDIPRGCLNDASRIQVHVVTDNLVNSPCQPGCNDERFDTWTSPWIGHTWFT